MRCGDDRAVHGAEPAVPLDRPPRVPVHRHLSPGREYTGTDGRRRASRRGAPAIRVGPAARLLLCCSASPTRGLCAGSRA
jgi:hypothetical protein